MYLESEWSETNLCKKIKVLSHIQKKTYALKSEPYSWSNLFCNNSNADRCVK